MTGEDLTSRITAQTESRQIGLDLVGVKAGTESLRKHVESPSNEWEKLNRNSDSRRIRLV